MQKILKFNHIAITTTMAIATFKLMLKTFNWYEKNQRNKNTKFRDNL